MGGTAAPRCRAPRTAAVHGTPHIWVLTPQCRLKVLTWAVPRVHSGARERAPQPPHVPARRRGAIQPCEGMLQGPAAPSLPKLLHLVAREVGVPGHARMAWRAALPTSVAARTC